MKDTKSLLLVLLSAGLVATWVYHLYDKTIYSNRRTEVYIKDSVAVAEGIRDSLQKIYSGTITDLGSRLDSTASNADSLQNALSQKMGQIRNLQQEINGILTKKGATREELASARSKIDQLQGLVRQLRSQNKSMEDEQKRLSLVMDQLNGDIRGLQQNIQKLGDENKDLTEKINAASVFVASEVNLSAVMVRGSREEQTSSARKTRKFVASFRVQNNVNAYSNAEVFMVLTGPDGQIIQNPVWDSGTMDTRNEGRKQYSIKVHFEYDKGDSKQLLFSLNTDSYRKGVYLLQLYHNGYMIGQASKKLG